MGRRAQGKMTEMNIAQAKEKKAGGKGARGGNQGLSGRTRVDLVYGL